MKIIGGLIFLMLISNVMAFNLFFNPTSDCPYTLVPPGCILDDDCDIACDPYADSYSNCDDYGYYEYCDDDY